MGYEGGGEKTDTTTKIIQKVVEVPEFVKVVVEKPVRNS